MEGLTALHDERFSDIRNMAKKVRPGLFLP